MKTLWQDLRYGMRMLLKNLAFTLVAVVTLALGIGANTALFSMVDAVLLRPLPFVEPDRLVTIERAGLLINLFPDSPARFMEWREETAAFGQVAAHSSGSVNLTEGLQPERVLTMQVSANFFRTLGVRPVTGRDFLPEEEKPGRNQVVIIGYGLWQRRFGSDPNLLGKTVALNGRTFTVVGIMPADFQFPTYPDKAEMWVPLVFMDDLFAAEGVFYDVIGRLKPGITMAQAQAEMDNISRRLQQTTPHLSDTDRIHLTPLRNKFVGNTRPALLILLGAVALVLLIACANVANLLLARAAARQKEVAIRSALGASRLRLVQQWLTESLLLALIGGAAGLLVAAWSVDALIAISPVYMPLANTIGIDGRVFAFTLLVALATGVLCGLAPALQFSKINLNQWLKEGGTKSHTVAAPMVRRVLIVSEIAAALVLLIGAGLLLKSFVHLLRVEPGFNPDSVLTFEVSPPKAKYGEAQQKAAFYRQIIERVSRVPEVQFVGGVNQLPLNPNNGSMFLCLDVEGRPETSDWPLSGAYRIASPDYFRAMEVPLLKGRCFTERDIKDAPPVMIINERLASAAFPNEDPIGKRLIVGGSKNILYEIVGIVGNIRQWGLKEESMAEFYLSYAQRPAAFMSLAVRTSNDPGRVINAVRQAVWQVDADQPVYYVKTMNEIISNSVSQQRFAVLLLGIFAGLATTLAVVGVYGVISFSVVQRTHEIGIRMALGAQGSDVLQMVMWQGFKLALTGVAVGLAGALALSSERTPRRQHNRRVDICNCLSAVGCCGTSCQLHPGTKSNEGRARSGSQVRVSERMKAEGWKRSNNFSVFPSSFILSK